MGPVLEGSLVTMDSVMSYNSSLSVDTPPVQRRGLGIICTIGPSSRSVEMLTKLRQAGMNIVRMNFSHGDYEFHAQTIAMTRQSVAEWESHRPVAIALDTKGPEVRTGVVPTGEVELIVDMIITVTNDPAHENAVTAELIYLDYPYLTRDVQVGGKIYIDDGMLTLQVVEKVDDVSLKAKVLNPGKLSSHKGVNLADIEVDLPALSERDKADLQFGVEHGIDMVFASFIRKASDVESVRECLGERGKNIQIISKIESHEGVRNINEIIEATDGVMVARGDMGVAIGPEKVFVAQSLIAAKCNIAGKPCICATQMLESMTYNPRPTRAEVSDVGNAVMDGVDCVMLSGETAKGKFPIESVTMMSRICQQAEAAYFYSRHLQNMMMCSPAHLDTSESVAMSACVTADRQNVAAILTLTNSGTSARLLSKYRPRCPILAVSRNPQVLRQCHLHRGVFPYEFIQGKAQTWEKDVEERIAFMMEKGKEDHVFKSGDIVIVVRGPNPKENSSGEHISLSTSSLVVVP
eukprot:c52305_g1_i1.p1 GENE.c52305_g1_i1~~c52305_g1_i1.p1  ORF type:complete len:521 (+),score=133.48 c52305_g1_i1:1-1563(+)